MEELKSYIVEFDENGAMKPISLSSGLRRGKIINDQLL